MRLFVPLMRQSNQRADCNALPTHPAQWDDTYIDADVGAGNA